MVSDTPSAPVDSSAKGLETDQEAGAAAAAAPVPAPANADNDAAVADAPLQSRRTSQIGGTVAH